MASGIFIPMMVVGGSLGRYVGWIVAQIVPQLTIDSSIYAVVGSAALMAGMILVNFIFVAYIAFAGSLRLTISLVVIIVELTEGTQYLLPIVSSFNF